MRSMTEGLLHSQDTTPQAAIAASSPCTGEPKNDSIFTVFQHKMESVFFYEDITYTEKGKMRNDSFLQYKIPTRLDVGNIRVEFESSYEQTGPFGAKSIGEIVINTPSPALAHAVYNATKVNIRTLPITSEKIVMGMINK